MTDFRFDDVLWAALREGAVLLLALAGILTLASAELTVSWDWTPWRADAVAEAATAEGSQLALPVEGVTRSELRDSFDEPRDGHTHHAIDIPAPHGTAVRAAAAGPVARIHTSTNGGRSVYQLSADSSRVYYYAHLGSYAAGLHEGQRLQRGMLIGTVGTTGNAPVDAPHLHFAIWHTDPAAARAGNVWEGDPINPYPRLAQ
jgi:murein DD-endopeptidase MepM/ murein hydrolase activator NlpD